MHRPTRFVSTPVLPPPPVSLSCLFQSSSPQPTTSRMRSPGSFTPSPVPQQQHRRETSYPAFNPNHPPNCGHHLGAGSYPPPGYSGGGVNCTLNNPNPCQTVDLRAPRDPAIYNQQLQLQFFSELSDKLSKKDEEIGKLKARVSYSDKELKEVKSRSQTYAAELFTLNQVKAEMGTSMGKLDEMKRRNEEHIRKLADANKQVADLTKEKVGLVAENEKLLERIQTLEGAAEVSARQLVEKTFELELQGEQKGAIENELKECKSKLEEELTNKEEKEKEYESSVTRFKTQVDTLEEELKNKEEKEKEYKKSITSFKTQVETLENDFFSQLAEKTAELENVRKEKISVETDLKGKDEKEKQQEEVIQSLRIQLEAGEMNLEGRRDNSIIQRLSRENAALQRTIVGVMHSTRRAGLWSERLEDAKLERRRMADNVINMFTRDSNGDRDNASVVNEFVTPHPVFNTPATVTETWVDIKEPNTTSSQSTSSQASSEPVAGPSSACVLPACVLPVDEFVQNQVEDNASGQVMTDEMVQPVPVIEMSQIKQEVDPPPSPRRNPKRLILNAHCAPAATPSAGGAENRTCAIVITLSSDDSSDESEPSASPVPKKKTGRPPPKRRRMSQRRKIPKKR